MIAKLNLGCGRTSLPGFLGLDMTLSAAVDVQASATELPFKDDSFDLVVASHILEHIPDSVLVSQGNGRVRQMLGLDRLRDEVDRVLRPGGRFLIRVPYRESSKYEIYHFKQFDRKSFKAWAGEATCLQYARRFVYERDYVSTWAEAVRFTWHVRTHFPRLWHLLQRTIMRQGEFPGDAGLRFPGKLLVPSELTVVLRKPAPSQDSLPRPPKE
jgi:SAM-dependent methyltransferase